MNAIAKFEKVSFEQFEEDVLKTYSPDFSEMNRFAIQIPDTVKEKVLCAYGHIKPPTRATSGSAGYDFYLPCDVSFKKDEWLTIPTGIRCKIEPGWFLSALPKSGLGFKHHFQLANTIGVIDADYYGSSNEGHIMAKVKMNKDFEMAEGQKFMQGIFLPYGITIDDDTNGVRDGGFGSTGA